MTDERVVRHGTRYRYGKGCTCELCVDAARDYRLRRIYGVTLAQYRGMLVNQDRKCGACGLEWEGWERNFSVDHDHVTGHVRGLLCQPCNLALGHAGDSQERLLQLVDYLRRHSFGH